MPKDRIGNPLEVGDLVELAFCSPVNPAHSVQLLGRVKRIDGGGVVIPGGQKLRPGQQPAEHVTLGNVHIEFQADVPVDPHTNLAGNIIKVVDPAKGERQTGLVH